MSSLRSQAIDIIKQKGLKKLPEPIQLASGAMSQDFVDGKPPQRTLMISKLLAKRSLMEFYFRVLSLMLSVVPHLAQML